jgi:hypothetical protein
VLGIVGGRLAWHAFAGPLGMVPIVEVSVPVLILASGRARAGRQSAGRRRGRRTKPAAILHAE